MGQREEESVAGPGPTGGALFCDTNVLVRLLTGEPASQADAAQAALDAAGEGPAPLILNDVVVAELAYVLTEVYELTNAEAAALIARLLDLPGVQVLDEQVLREALGIWESVRLDFADAYLAALARSVRDAGVLSFDRDFDRVPGVRRTEPSAIP